MSTFEILQAACWITLAAAGLLLLRAELLAHRQHLLSARGLPQPGRPSRAAAGRHRPGAWHRLRQTARRHGDQAVAVLLKVEILVAIVVAVVLFVLWSAHQRADFNQRSNNVLCGLLQDHC